MILDSSFLIDLIAVDEAAEAKLQELVEDAVPITVSALTVTEVRRGIDTDDARNVFDDVMDAVTVAPFGYAEAMTAAALLRRLDRQGDPIGAVDAMIAATALERNEKVLTRNVSDFSRIDELRTTPY